MSAFREGTLVAASPLVKADPGIGLRLWVAPEQLRRARWMLDRDEWKRASGG
jgi:hypothetical protein